MLEATVANDDRGPGEVARRLLLARTLDRDIGHEKLAMEAYVQAERLAETTGDARLGTIQLALAELYARTGDVHAEQALLERRIRGAKAGENPAAQADALYRLGALLLDQEGRAAEGIRSIERGTALGRARSRPGGGAAAPGDDGAGRGKPCGVGPGAARPRAGKERALVEPSCSSRMAWRKAAWSNNPRGRPTASSRKLPRWLFASAIRGWSRIFSRGLWHVRKRMIGGRRGWVRAPRVRRVSRQGEGLCRGGVASRTRGTHGATGPGACAAPFGGCHGEGRARRP